MLVDEVLRGVFGGRRKRSTRALRYLTGGSRSLLSNPTALWTAAGLAWGVIETLQGQGAQVRGEHGAQVGAGAQVPGAQGAPVPLPPLPNVGGASASVPSDVLRLVWLAISAANADGTLKDEERAAIARHAEASGGSDLLAAELSQPRPVAEIVSGVTDPAQRATLYVLAYTILRADEQVSGAERIYLAQLAHLLGLSPADVQRLENDTGQRIDAQEGET